MKNNVILLCGGIGRRMSPIPRCNKSLLNIRGEMNLHRIVRIFYTKGIRDFVVATNPVSAVELREICNSFSEEFEGINLEIVEAKDYTEGCNNIVTMRAVADFIENTYIVETDQFYIEENMNFLQDEPHFHSYFFTQRREVEDWGVITNLSNRITHILHENPNNSLFCLSGLSYFTGESARILRDNLSSSISDDIYWEEAISLEECPISEWSLPNYAIEFDNISDLIDKKLMDPQDIANLIDDNHNAERLNSMTNNSYKVKIDGVYYALRLPGYGTDRFINHHREEYTEMEVPVSIRPSSRYFSNGSVKLSEYLHDYSDLCRVEDIPKVLNLLEEHVHLVQDTPAYNELRIDLVEEINSYERIFIESRETFYTLYYPNYNRIKKLVIEYLGSWFNTHEYERVHRDLVPSNIQINSNSDSVKLIDWEYSGFLSRYWDLASLCCEFHDEFGTDLDYLVDLVCQEYKDIEKDILYSWLVIVDFVWSVWSLAKLSLGDNVLDYGVRRYKRACSVLESIEANSSSLSSI